MKLIAYILAPTLALLCACSHNQVPEADPHPNMTHLENRQFATPDNPVVAPSGNYVLVIDAGFNDAVYDNGFSAYDSADPDTPIFTANTRYRTRDRLYFTWDENDNIWVYSGDTGLSFWEKQDGLWVAQPTVFASCPKALLDILPKSYLNPQSSTLYTADCSYSSVYPLIRKIT